MLLRFVWVSPSYDGTPSQPKALGKNLSTNPVPSPREALQEFSAVVITGGSSGIGKSFIELCGTLHPELWFCNLSRSVPSMLKGKLKLCHVPCDLEVPESAAGAAAAVESWLSREVPAGRVLLINNSGFGSYGRFPEPNLRHQLGIIDVNIRGLVDLTGNLLPRLRERGGAIVNVASLAAYQPTPFMATYGATKAFVLHWSLALNEELLGSGLRVLAVCPGPTATNFSRRAGLKDRSALSAAQSKSMTSEEVVLATLGALGERKAVVVPGAKNQLIAAISSFVPRTLITRVAAKAIERYRVRREQA